MRKQFWLRAGAALAAVGVIAAASAVQARDLSCAMRGRELSVPLRIAQNQKSAAFGEDPSAPTVVTEDEIRWSGPENGRGYAATYVLNRNTGVLTRMAPVLFDKGLTSMWPTTFDCGGAPTRVD